MEKDALLQDIINEVVKKLQTEISGTSAPVKQLGVFAEMTEAIDASIKAQKVMQKLTMDAREKIISNIRKKTIENAEIFAKMAVEETGMGNVGDKILKHQL